MHVRHRWPVRQDGLYPACGLQRLRYGYSTFLYYLWYYIHPVYNLLLPPLSQAIDFSWLCCEHIYWLLHSASMPVCYMAAHESFQACQVLQIFKYLPFDSTWIFPPRLICHRYNSIGLSLGPALDSGPTHSTDHNELHFLSRLQKRLSGPNAPSQRTPAMEAV